jgi:hypothetical protein
VNGYDALRARVVRDLGNTTGLGSPRMKLAHLAATLALVSCGGQVAGSEPTSGSSGHGSDTGSGTGASSAPDAANASDDASAPACVTAGVGEWLCAGLGTEPGCPGGIVAGATCLNGVITSNPQMPAHLTAPGFSCLACANGEGTVWTCEASGWQSGATLSCSP